MPTAEDEALSTLAKGRIEYRPPTGRQRRGRFAVHTPYAREIVELIQDISGATWDSRALAWIVPARSAGELAARAAEIDLLADRAMAGIRVNGD